MNGLKDLLTGDTFCQNAAEIWNSATKVFYSLLTVNPQSAGGGEPWGVISSIYPYFLAIASSLLVLFFIIGYCRENIDLKQQLTFEKSFTMILRLIIANGLMVGILKYIPVFFSAAISMTELVGGVSYHELVVPELTEEWSFFGFILGFVTVCVALAASVVLIITVFSRFIKILIIIPMAPIAMSTFAGGGAMSQTGVAWIKTFLSYTFEIVVIGISFCLGNALAGSNIIPSDNVFTSAYSGVAMNMILSMVIVVSAVKGAEGTLRKCMNL